MLFLYMFRWFADIVIESTYEGHHTFKVQQGIRLGMCLFIVSEIMFFFSFFWAFFHCSLSPAIAIGFIWPPLGIITLDPFSLPLLNTIILLSSGVTITCAHRAIIVGERNATTNGLISTNNRFKIAIAYNGINSVLYINGVSFTNIIGTIPTFSGQLNTIEFNQGNGGRPFFGRVNNLIVYPNRLSNSQLQQLTTL